MANILAAATGNDPSTGSNIGSTYTVTTIGDQTNRETNIVTEAELAFGFTPVTAPSILIVKCISLFDPAVGDPTTSIYWGYATGVYEHELFIGETAVVRLRAGGPITQIFMISADVATPTHFNVESQVWEQ